MKDTRKILNEALEKSKRVVVAHQTVIDEVEAKLAELDKPKLERDGDYGVGGDEAQPYSRLRVGGDVYNECGCKNPEGRNPEQDVWLGNVFDDMKRNQEDLRIFRISGMTVRIKGDDIYIEQGDDKLIVLPSRQTEFIQKLSQLIATAKRDAAK